MDGMLDAEKSGVTIGESCEGSGRATKLEEEDVGGIIRDGNAPGACGGLNADQGDGDLEHGDSMSAGLEATTDQNCASSSNPVIILPGASPTTPEHILERAHDDPLPATSILSELDRANRFEQAHLQEDTEEEKNAGPSIASSSDDNNLLFPSSPPRSRRVGITGVPHEFKRPPSLQHIHTTRPLSDYIDPHFGLEPTASPHTTTGPVSASTSTPTDQSERTANSTRKQEQNAPPTLTPTTPASAPGLSQRQASINSPPLPVRSPLRPAARALPPSPITILSEDTPTNHFPLAAYSAPSAPPPIHNYARRRVDSYSDSILSSSPSVSSDLSMPVPLLPSRFTNGSSYTSLSVLLDTLEAEVNGMHAEDSVMSGSSIELGFDYCDFEPDVTIELEKDRDSASLYPTNAGHRERLRSARESVLSNLTAAFGENGDAASELTQTEATNNPPPSANTFVKKRTHALLELLTSERAYASDLALIRDVHIPLALGQPTPFAPPNPTSPPALSPSSFPSSTSNSQFAFATAQAQTAMLRGSQQSASSSRTVSTASSTSAASSELGPPMSRDDTRIVFGNVAELAVFADHFCERLERALGGALYANPPSSAGVSMNGGRSSGEDSGVGSSRSSGGMWEGTDDTVGELFLEIVRVFLLICVWSSSHSPPPPTPWLYARIHPMSRIQIPSLEPPYKQYITKHPTALAHLTSLSTNPTPALAEYLARTRELASSLTHAWDLPSLLIKPVQRLLKYPLLIQAILDATPAGHPDLPRLRQAKERMEDVARSVNEGRRRWEVVRDVLGGSKPDSSGKGGKKKSGVAVPAGVNLGRMKTFRTNKPKDRGEREETAQEREDHEETELIDSLADTIKRHGEFLPALGRQVLGVHEHLHAVILRLRDWAQSFGRVIGLTPDMKSEAFDAFLVVVYDEFLGRATALEEELRTGVLADLGRLRESTQNPIKLIDAMHDLAPLHQYLLNLNFAKQRPSAAMLEASQSYVALRGQLAMELPAYVDLLNAGVARTILRVSGIMERFWHEVWLRWGDLWDALRVEGERNAGAEETLRVWWERWGDAEKVLRNLMITSPWKAFADMERERLREKEREREREREILRELQRERDKESQRDKERTRKSTGDIDRGNTKGAGMANITATLASLDPYVNATSPTSKHSSSSATSRHRSGSGSGTAIGRNRSTESLTSGKSSKMARSNSGKTRNTQEFNDPNAPPLPVPSQAPGMPKSAMKSKPARMKSTPMLGPLRTPSRGDLNGGPESPFPPSPLSIDFDPTNVPADEREQRGRDERRPSLKTKITDSLRPGHNRKRSSSVKSLGAPSTIAPSYHTTDTPLPKYTHRPNSSVATTASGSSSSHRVAQELCKARALYGCRVVHPCVPPPGVSYRGLPFFRLDVDATFDVLREYGHPSTHPHLPLYVDDGEDCLLLVRDKVTGTEVGWALASFLIPFD